MYSNSPTFNFWSKNDHNWSKEEFKFNFKIILALLWKGKFFLLTTWFVATLFFPLLTKVADLPLKRIYEQFITQERHKAGQSTWEKYLARGLLTKNIIYCGFSSYIRICIEVSIDGFHFFYVRNQKRFWLGIVESF